MKKWTKILMASLAVIVLATAACQKEKEMEFTEAAKPLTGSWRIVKVVRNGEDLTSRFNFAAFRISFTENAYSITNPVPFVVSKNGKWQFDDPQYPMELSFTPDGGSAVKPTFRYPVVKGKRNLVLLFSPGCTQNNYEYTLEPLQ